MPLYTESISAPAFSDADLTFPTSDVLAATASEAFLDAPLLSALPRAIELDVAQKRYGGAYQNFSKADAFGWLEKRGLTAQDLPLEDRTYNELELSILARRKVAEIRRRQVLEGGEGGFAEGAARLGTALGVSVLDPLNVASGFVPVIGEARYGALLARAGGLAGRTGVRLGVGAAEGTVGAALLEPIVAGARMQELADYHASDSLLNIAFGGVLGGGLHAVGGGVSDALARQLPSAQIMERTSAIADTPPASVAGEAAAAPAPVADPFRPTAKPDTVIDAYFQQAETIRAQMLAARDVNVNDPKVVARALGRSPEQAPKSLWQFIRDTGGIADSGGELSARDILPKDAPKLIVRNVDGNPGKAGFDAVRERVFEAGYFPSKSDYNEISDSELLDALAADVAGDRVYALRDMEDIARLQAESDYLDRMAADGFSRDMTPTQIADRLREMDDAAQAEAAREAGIDPDTLAEYDRSAAREVSQASEPARGAALRVAVAQAVDGQPIRVEGTLRGDAAQIRMDSQPRIDDDPMLDERAAQQADNELAEQPNGEAADLAAIEQEIADYDESLELFRADIEAEGIDTELPADLRAEQAAVDEFTADAANTAEIARRAAICAMRSA